MSISQPELRAIVMSSLPDGFLDETMRTLLRANVSAKSACATFAETEKRDSFGHIQRAHFEGAWRGIAARFRGVTASSRKNKKRTQSFTTLRVGPLVITESAVQFPRIVMPRDAHFRNVLAGPQMDLLDDSPIPPESIFVIFTHANDRYYRPIFSSVIAPDAGCRYSLVTIPLTERMAELREEMRDEPGFQGPDYPEEKIEEPAAPPLRPNAKKRKTEDAG